MQAIPEEEEEVERPQRPNTMEEFWRPIIQEEYSAMRQPSIEANNFELKLALITMVQQHQFTGQPFEDLNEHLGRFMRMANTVKLNGGETRCNQASTIPIFIERHGNNLV